MARFLLPVILIFLAGGLFLTFTKDTYADAQGLVLQIEKYNETLEKARELQTVRNDLVTKYNNFRQDDLDRLERLLPKKVDNVRLIIEIQSIAEAHEIELTNVLVNDVAEAVSSSNEEDASLSLVPSLRTVALQISFAAPYEDYILFLKDLEKSLRIVDVRASNFQSGNDEDTQYTLALETYWLE